VDRGDAGKPIFSWLNGPSVAFLPIAGKTRCKRHAIGGRKGDRWQPTQSLPLQDQAGI
jgi:hypothetical protein